MLYDAMVGAVAIALALFLFLPTMLVLSVKTNSRRERNVRYMNGAVVLIPLVASFANSDAVMWPTLIIAALLWCATLGLAIAIRRAAKPAGPPGQGHQELKPEADEAEPW